MHTPTPPSMAKASSLSNGALLSLVQAMVNEMHPSQHAPAVALGSRLERDLGLDSLGRVELLLRIEQASGMTLAEQDMLDATTVGDLFQLLGKDVGGRELASPPIPAAAWQDQRPLNSPAQADTLAQMLVRQAQQAPDWHYLYLYEGSDEPQPVSFGDLVAGAEIVAGGLRERDVEPGQCVAIMLPTSRDFFAAYYGILFAGAVPVPIYPPTSRAGLADHLKRQAGILNNALAPILISTVDAKPVTRVLQALCPSLRSISTVAELGAAGSRACLLGRPDDLALIQYTSGSTGQPKGVMLSNANLLANVAALGQVTRVSNDDRFVSWLPLYHDMGLIGACFGTLCHGVPLALMSPLAFITRPRRWLHAIHKHRGTLSAAPNFAYQLCASRLTDADLEDLDLSCWRLALNGAEPVHAVTLESFIERLAPYGFAREAMTPVYGLAENSVGLAFPPLGRGPRVERIDRERFAAQGRAQPAGVDEANALYFVSGGLPLPGHEIRIVDAYGHELPERQQGLLQFRGPSATSGYLRNPQASAELFDADWLNAGDYAYLADGEVFITGRAKDVIIRAGRNIYPYELEQAVGELPGIRQGAVAVFATTDPAATRERLIVLAETRFRDENKLAALKGVIGGLATELTGSEPDDIVLAPPRSVLKTSSGKIRRAACRAAYDQGRFSAAPRRSARSASLRSLAAAAPLLQRAARLLRDYAYAGYAWLVFLMLGIPANLLLVIIPSRKGAYRIAHLGSRLLARLLGIRVQVRGLENLEQAGICVVAANHASYIDAIVLIAASPLPMHFVAKAELRRYLPIRLALERLGTEFVKRSDAQHGIQVTEKLAERVRRSRVVVYFPEATFTRAVGLRPFRMGAFVTAARTRVPLVPIAIHGSRSILRGDSWFPRRGELDIAIGEAIHPRDDSWASAVRLRAEARAFILEHCGEPDLADHSSIALAVN